MQLDTNLNGPFSYAIYPLIIVILLIIITIIVFLCLNIKIKKKVKTVPVVVIPKDPNSIKKKYLKELDDLINKMDSLPKRKVYNNLSIIIRSFVLEITSIDVLKYSLNEIKALKTEYERLRQLKPRVIENFKELNDELSETQQQILSFENYLKELQNSIVCHNEAIKRLISDLVVINSDIRNNKDAARLQKFGSEITGYDISANTCPVCKQHIQDNLLNAETASKSMSIEENISHLEEQKKMLKFTLSSREKSLDKISKEKEDVEMRLQSLRRLAHTIRSDIFTTTDTEDSETIMLKRIDISNRIERLSKLKISVSTLVEELMQVSGEWNIYLDQKSKLPKSNITESDNEKIALLRKKFIENLSRYHYRSLSSLEEIDISMESSLLPTIDGFDMKFDSSASDGVRVIWAFTLALLQVSIEKGGNHPGMIIFDEPAQQSIVPDDMKSFIDSVLELKKPFQIITAITLNSQELIEIINELDESSCSRIDIEGKAFKKLA